MRLFGNELAGRLRNGKKPAGHSVQRTGRLGGNNLGFNFKAGGLKLLVGSSYRLLLTTRALGLHHARRRRAAQLRKKVFLAYWGYFNLDATIQF